MSLPGTLFLRVSQPSVCVPNSVSSRSLKRGLSLCKDVQQISDGHSRGILGAQHPRFGPKRTDAGVCPSLHAQIPPPNLGVSLSLCPLQRGKWPSETSVPRTRRSESG